MDKKTKILFLLLLLSSAVSIWFLYKRAFITQDFDVEVFDEELEDDGSEAITP
ncbi:MAG: hypothetical protein AAB458_00040 [Patescibacteria group bacterium]